jgi:hypothetical protein
MVTPAKSLPLTTSKAPNLPVAKEDYEKNYFDQILNSLRLYFTQLDNINQVSSQRVSSTGVLFPDGTSQTTAWVPSWVETYDRTASIAITTTPTLLKPGTLLTGGSGITYDPTTGVFTFKNAGTYSLSISLNISASSANQNVYVYAQKNTGTGWVNNANSGKLYDLTNNQITQFVSPQSVYRQAGEQTRYYIYSNGSTSSLVTNTLPTVSPTVYVPAIRIQFAGG